MVSLKICGLTQPADVAFCCACGVDLVGFVVDYPKRVPWNLDVPRARELMTRLSGKSRSVMVTGGAPEDILSRALALHPDFVQLHYRETPEETQFLAAELSAHGIGCIKAIPVRPDGTPDMPGFQTAEGMAARYAGTGVGLLLLDARCPSAPETNGAALDAALYRRVAGSVEVPVVLAGGLTPRNLAAVLSQTGALHVDVLSGAERSPGVKDRHVIRLLREITQNCENPRH